MTAARTTPNMSAEQIAISRYRAIAFMIRKPASDEVMEVSRWKIGDPPPPPEIIANPFMKRMNPARAEPMKRIVYRCRSGKYLSTGMNGVRTPIAMMQMLTGSENEPTIGVIMERDRPITIGRYLPDAVRTFFKAW